MNLAIDDVVSHLKWEVFVLNWVRRFYVVSDMVRLWRSNVLLYTQCRTRTISHASQLRLSHIHALQESYLRDLGLSPLDALVHFKLAPLACRRDIVLLGVIHRAAPKSFPRIFPATLAMDEATDTAAAAQIPFAGHDGDTVLIGYAQFVVRFDSRIQLVRSKHH